MDRVLVIDDNVDFLESMGFCLEDGGFQVEAAKTAAEGLRAALKAPPRVILLDLNLPDRSGLSVLRELNKRSVTAPVLMVTGFPTSRNGDGSLAARGVGLPDKTDQSGVPDQDRAKFHQTSGVFGIRGTAG